VLLLLLLTSAVGSAAVLVREGAVAAGTVGAAVLVGAAGSTVAAVVVVGVAVAWPHAARIPPIGSIPASARNCRRLMTGRVGGVVIANSLASVFGDPFTTALAVIHQLYVRVGCIVNKIVDNIAEMQ
jgi:hypothetical protein